jgi:SGNH hydrolase-like domain, acetyltransferase AlgX
MKRFLQLSAVLFVGALLLPLFQMGSRLPIDYPLMGVETTSVPPTVSPRAWWDGTLQSEFETWLNQRIGFRGLLVRTANQINYTLFRELPQRSGTQVLLGQDGFLYEKVYIDSYNQEGVRPEDELRHVSMSTRRLQDRLAQDGIAFLLVIAPSKAEIYPEFLPDSADVEGRPGRRTNYENMIGILNEDGVNLVDAHDLFLQWKEEPGTPLLYTKGGTHWNQYGAARIISRMTEKLKVLMGKDVPTMQVVGAVTNRTIVDSDNDLAELVNLWSGRQLAGPQIHPVMETTPGTHLPDLLVVGDSFVFTLTNQMDSEELYRKRDTYYYYNRHYFYPVLPNLPLDKRHLDLLKELQGRDAVVVEVGEYWLPRIGFGFVKDLLRAYDALDAVRAEPSAP